LPTTKTAEKEMRLAQKRKDRNKSTRSETKTKVVKAGAAISSGDIDKAKSAVITAISSIDKEVEKGSMHRNSAARRKSRLMKKLNLAASSGIK
jgi:small subunit ribosomal protein S20